MINMLEIKDLTSDLGEFKLKNIDLTVDDGEYFVILGPTAAGKTILLEVIAGIYSADGGQIILNGKDITNMAPKDRPITIVYQDFMLFPHLTIEENIRFGLEAEGFPKDRIPAKVDQFVELLNISDILHRHPGTLSGGEKQRAALARSLVMDPDVMLLDEPLSALDVPTQESIIKELEKIHRETEVTIIHVTHSREEAIKLGDRIAIMNDGQIVQDGDVNRIFKEPNSTFVADFVGMENIFEGESRLEDGIAVIRLEDGNEIESVSNLEGHVRACIRPEEIIISTNPMEHSGRNMMKGRITDSFERESIMRLRIDAGLDFTAIITKRSYADMCLERDMEVYLSFKATAVHLI
jgi:molybdate transport system ATP-binding protein/molybdate/tungstate transport system ATP-binding protein